MRMRIKKEFIIRATGGALLLFLGVFFLSGCSSTEAGEKEFLKKVSVQKVGESGSSTHSVYSGTLEGLKETDLSAKAPGRVSAINVDLGEKTEKGQLLARLEGDNQQIQEDMMYNYYQNSLGNLEETKLLMSGRIDDARAALDAARENLALAKTSRNNEGVVYPEKLKQAEIELEKAKTSKENIENKFSQKEKDILDSAMSSVRQTNTLAKNSLSFIYSINNEILPDSNNDFDIADKFVTTDSQLVIDTDNQVKKVKEKVFDFEDYYNSNLKGLAAEKANRREIVKGAKKAEATLRAVNQVLSNMKDILNQSITHSGLSRSALDNYSLQTNEYIGRVEKMLFSYDSGQAVGLVGVEQALENLEVERENQLSNIDKQIESAKQQINLLEKSNKAKNDTLSGNVSVAQTQVDRAEKALETAKRQYDSQVQQMKTQVDMARGDWRRAQAGITNTILKAPYGGVVVEKYLDEGQVINAGTPVVRIADTSKFKAVIYVPEEEASKISSGQTAQITKQGSEGKKWEARVKSVSPRNRQSSQKVEVELTVEDTNGLKIGDYVDVSFEFDGREGLYSIPDEAVKYFYDQSVVYVLKDEQAVRQEVEIKQTKKNNYLVKGVEKNEQVIVNGLEGVRDGDKVQVVK